MVTNGNPPVGVSHNIKQLGRMDLAGGGSVVVENGYAYIGHMDPPHGTSIIDVRDPKNPKVIAHLEIAEGLHSHKVRVSGDIMLVNYERYKAKQELQAGLKVFDISNKSKPREIAFYKAPGKGVHRFTFDGRYAYISPTVEGYVGNIAMILDLKNPQTPEEVCRRRRRDADLERNRYALSSSNPRRRPPVHQLLAWRVCHRRYLRHEQTEDSEHARLEPALSLSDAHDPADAQQNHGARLLDCHR